MQTIGERLEEARKRKGISIREAAEATKIRSDYLQKFEANSFDLDLPPLYIKGFVRSYARFLELDADRLLQEFAGAFAGDAKPARRETREVYGRVDFSEPPARATAAATEEQAEPSAPESRPQIDQALLLKWGVLGGGVLLAVLLIILVISLLSSRSDDTPARPRAGTGAGTPSVQADPAQTLTLTAIDATRVKVVQDFDSKVLFNGALARGETRSLPKMGAVLITVEDRTKIRVEVNGKHYDIPPLQGGNYGRFSLD
ncbi:MAG TPA: RodZ domain-containing protein [Opitutaceae bacterium]|nr:RodZ domain-containing protein [Opitutaceae bacterium]